MGAGSANNDGQLAKALVSLPKLAIWFSSLRMPEAFALLPVMSHRFATAVFPLSLIIVHKYFLKIPWWVRMLYPSYIWRVAVKSKTVFLTFDDGPHPAITPWVLEQLKQYGAAATFFCIGKNVVQYPDTYAQIIAAGHAVGNHTFSHLNGWKTPDEIYVADAQKAAAVMPTRLFRPPYGRIKKTQARRLSIMFKKYNVKIVMWDVLSADFDASFSAQACIDTVLRHTRPGSVIVFHDSEKAFPNLRLILPIVLAELHRQGFDFQAL